jgi:predicted transcriptional regulator
MHKCRETWYQAWLCASIEAVEIVGVTAQKLQLAGGRLVSKRGEYANYFSAWEEAWAFQVAKAERFVQICRSRLAVARKNLARAKAMRPPAAPPDSRPAAERIAERRVR